MADKLKARQENGHCVVETMKDIGSPATFQKIKSAVMTKMNNEADPKAVSTVIHGVLRKGVSNGFLYKNGRNYSTEPPSEAPRNRERKRATAVLSDDESGNEVEAHKKPAAKRQRQSRKSARVSKPKARKSAKRSRSRTRSNSRAGASKRAIAALSDANEMEVQKKPTGKRQRQSRKSTPVSRPKSRKPAKRSRSRTRSTSRAGTSKSHAKKVMKK